MNYLNVIKFIMVKILKVNLLSQPWFSFTLVGLAIGFSSYAFGFSRLQDATKTALWWFLLPGGLLSLCQLISGKSAARMWLIVCLIFGLDVAIQGVIRGFFGVNPQPIVIAEAVANTNLNESLEFLQAQRWQILWSCIYFSCLVLIGVFGQRAWINKNVYKNTNTKKNRWFSSVLLVSACLLHANPSMLGHEPFIRWGVVYLRYKQVNNEMSELIANRQNIWSKRNEFEVELTNNKPSTVVIIIGESANRMNWGLYGYTRDTTYPLREAFDQLGGTSLIFKNAKSSRAFTLPSLRLALTPANEQAPEIWNETPDFLMLGKSAGYQTTWISNQPKNDGWVTSLSHLAETKIFLNSGNWRDSSSEDEDLIPILENQLKVKVSSKELIILHLLGQHFHYSLRCGKTPAVFSSVTDDAVMKLMVENGRNKSTRQARNDYDDATLCGARNISKLIQIVAKERKDRQVKILFFSDHGQEVGHFRDFAGHSEQDESGYTVPLFIWSNEKVKSLYSAHIDSKIYLDGLDNSIQTLLDIRSKWYTPAADFLSPRYQQRTSK